MSSVDTRRIEHNRPRGFVILEEAHNDTEWCFRGKDGQYYNCFTHCLSCCQPLFPNMGRDGCVNKPRPVKYNSVVLMDKTCYPMEIGNGNCGREKLRAWNIEQEKWQEKRARKEAKTKNEN